MPDNSIIRGTKAPLNQKYVEKWSPTQGFSIGLDWMGFGEDEMRALATAYANMGLEYEFTKEHGVFTLHGATSNGTDQTGNVAIDTWEIASQDEIVSSLKNPVYNTSGAHTIPASYLEVIARAIKDGSSIEDASLALEADTGDIYSSAITDNDYAVRLYKRLLADQTGFFDSHYTLRHTTNVGNRWAVNIADLGINRVYTTAQLLSEAQNALLWVYPLPGRLAYKISALSADLIARYGTQSNYQWGWHKGASSEHTTANNRVNIVTEYKFYQWSTDEYELY